MCWRSIHRRGFRTEFQRSWVDEVDDMLEDSFALHAIILKFESLLIARRAFKKLFCAQVECLFLMMTLRSKSTHQGT